MKKIAKAVAVLALLAALGYMGTVAADRQNLSKNLIRLHVVADSDSQQDQNVKLQVRDAVIGWLRWQMADCEDVHSAKACLSRQLPQLEQIARYTLAEAGVSDPVTVTLAQEAFPTRDYDTFSLPAGVYESLRITIGEGSGQNWWCVVFPTLCLPATAEGFADTAAGAGFPDSLSASLSRGEGYEVRFFLLDCLGWLENLFYRD